jgi:hypothetical protein
MHLQIKHLKYLKECLSMNVDGIIEDYDVNVCFCKGKTVSGTSGDKNEILCKILL